MLDEKYFDKKFEKVVSMEVGEWDGSDTIDVNISFLCDGEIILLEDMLVAVEGTTSEAYLLSYRVFDGYPCVQFE